MKGSEAPFSAPHPTPIFRGAALCPQRRGVAGARGEGLSLGEPPRAGSWADPRVLGVASLGLRLWGRGRGGAKEGCVHSGGRGLTGRSLDRAPPWRSGSRQRAGAPRAPWPPDLVVCRNPAPRPRRKTSPAKTPARGLDLTPPAPSPALPWRAPRSPRPARALPFFRARSAVALQTPQRLQGSPMRSRRRTDELGDGGLQNLSGFRIEASFRGKAATSSFGSDVLDWKWRTSPKTSF